MSGGSAVTSRRLAGLPPGFRILWFTVALDLVGFGIVVPILGRYAERFGASGFEVGLLFASFSLAQLVFTPILGRLSDRIGRKPVILISLVGTAVGSFVTGAANSLWLLFLGRVLDGGSGASVSVAQSAVTDVASPADRPRLLGLIGAAFGLGFVVGPALGGLAALGGEHVPFFVAGTLAAINAVVAWFRLPETRPVETRRAEARANTDGRVRLWGIAVVGFIGIVAFSGFEATFSLLAGDRFDLTEAGIASVFVGVGVLLVIVQTTLIAPVNRRVGTEGSVRAGLVLDGCGLLVLAVADTWALLVPALVLLTVGQGLVTPNLSSLVSGRVDSHRRGEALGFQQGVNAVGRVAGPALAGVLYDEVSIGAPYAVGAALCAVALAVVVTNRQTSSVRERTDQT